MRAWWFSALIAAVVAVSGLWAQKAHAGASGVKVVIENGGGLHHADDGPFRPRVRVDGAVPDEPGRLNFTRYPYGCAMGSVNNPIGTVDITGPGPVVGPGINGGALGTFGYSVDYLGQESFSRASSGCRTVTVKKRTELQASLPSRVFTFKEPIVPQIRISNTTADAGGEVTGYLWPGDTCGGATDERLVERVTVSGQNALRRLEFAGVALGPHAFEARYSGDGHHDRAATACQNLTVRVDLTGYVFHDADGDAAKDSAESGLAGVTVTLKRGAKVVASTRTTADGAFEFPVAAAGEYRIVQSPVAGFSRWSFEYPLDLRYCCAVSTMVLLDNKATGGSATRPGGPAGLADGGGTATPSGQSPTAAAVGGESPDTQRRTASLAAVSAGQDWRPVVTAASILLIATAIAAFRWRRRVRSHR